MVRDHLITAQGTPTDLQVMAEAIGFTPAANAVALVQVDRDGVLRGGAIFQNFRVASIEIHIVGFHTHWVTRTGLRNTFHYPFVHCGCKKLLAPVPSYNTRSLEFCHKIGFNIEATISDVYPLGDLIVMSMRREDCRWLRPHPRS